MVHWNDNTGDKSGGGHRRIAAATRLRVFFMSLRLRIWLGRRQNNL